MTGSHGIQLQQHWISPQQRLHFFLTSIKSIKRQQKRSSTLPSSWFQVVRSLAAQVMRKCLCFRFLNANGFVGRERMCTRTRTEQLWLISFAFHTWVRHAPSPASALLLLNEQQRLNMAPNVQLIIAICKLELQLVKVILFEVLSTQWWESHRGRQWGGVSCD